MPMRPPPMPSLFTAAAAECESLLDEGLSEDISVVPMLRGELADTPDPGRDVLDLVALPSERDASSAQVPGTGARVAYEELELAILRTLIPAGYRIHKGDIVRLSDRPGVPHHKINRVDTNDPHRLVLVLGPVVKD